MSGEHKLKEEYEYIKNGSLKNINAHVSIIDNDFFHWFGTIIGPKKTLYDGFYIFEIRFDSNYPNSPPKFQMRTPIYHPNICCVNGNICTPYLYQWNNRHNITGLIHALFLLLAQPNECDAYYPYSKDYEKAKKFREKYATTYLYGKFDWKNSWDKGWDNNYMEKNTFYE